MARVWGVLDDAVGAVLAAYPIIHTAYRRRSPLTLERRRRGSIRLTPQLASVLEQLDPVKPLGAGELADRMRVTPATISLQLARLVRLRLVTRMRDERDARRVLLRLTDNGVRLRAQRSLLDPDRVRSALTKLAAGEQDAVAAGVRLLARAARTLPPDTGGSAGTSLRSNPA